jgi:sugar lactone lactonase YvrE
LKHQGAKQVSNLNFDRALGLCIATALIAGCGGAQPPLVASGLPQGVPQRRAIVQAQGVGQTYKASGPLLYVASADEGITPLAIYKANANDPKPFATISKDISSSGDCIDGDGTLYVTNYSGSESWVSEYALGDTKPVRVITKGINTPAYCAIDAPGNLWVTNIGLDDVAEFLKGSTTPHATITKGLTYPVGIAIDHAGNLYVGNNMRGYGQSNIEVYAPGSESPSRTITDAITWPVGIAVDARGTLYVANLTLGRSDVPGNVEEYRYGQSTPYRTITDKIINPADVVVDKNGWLYVANWAHTSQQQTVILEFPPHSLRPSSKEITKGFFDPQGLAYFPPVLP